MEVIIRSGIIVTGLLFIRKLAMGKISRKFQYYMWGILPIVLLSFPYFRIPVPAFKENVTWRADYRQGKTGDINGEVLREMLWEIPLFPDNQENAPEVQQGNDFPEGNERKEENQTGAEQKILFYKNVPGIIRNTVTVVLFGFILGANGIFAVKLQKKRIFLKEDKETKTKIYLLEECAAPFLFGKNIYLHPDMTKNPESMRYMILHEYCHLKQGDLLFTSVRNFLCAIYWFDPFVWLAACFINRDCELACDEAVIRIIGMDRRQEYGLTLLELLKERGKRGPAAGISMAGKKSLLRERILFLSKPFQKRKGSGWTLGALAGCMVLTGCSLMGNGVSAKRQMIKEPTGVSEGQQRIEEITSVFDERQDSDEMLLDLKNNYYNNAKINEEELYFTQSGYLCSMDSGSKAVKQIEKGKFILGNIDGGYLYYLKYPADSEEENGIGRINLTTMERRILLPWEEKYWSCTEIYSKDGYLYLGLENGCEAFSTDDGQALNQDEHENKIAGAVKPFEDLMEKGTVNFGYINSIFNFQMFAVKDGKTDTLYICDTKEKRTVKKTGCLGDVLISEYGVVYLMLNGDIYLSPLDNPDENRLLFSASENGNGVTYGAYDENGLYVFEKDNDTVKCKCILWEGGMDDVKEFPGIRLSIDLKFSAFTDFVVYFENEEMNLMQMRNRSG